MQRILLCGLNWIGDTLMSMPAIQTFRQHHPDAHITLLVKPGMKALWEMHDVPDAIFELQSGLAGTLKTIKTLRHAAFDTVYILPNSFRSAFIPFAARIPTRTGMSGHARDWMLSRVVHLPPSFATRHQAYEYYQLLDLPLPEPLPRPVLTLSSELTGWAETELTDYPAPYTALIPGAARGPSKQWPANHYIELGKRLQQHTANTTLVMGSPGEKELCEKVAAGIGSNAYSYAGKTNIKQWAALMSLCKLVIANDSGGMHLASAVGAQVIAIYGITDPDKTGPLGPDCQVIQKSDIRQRDIPRDSQLARRKLQAITPEEIAAIATKKIIS